jgi:hypothetical protein
MKGLVARTTKDTKHTKNERLTRADDRDFRLAGGRTCASAKTTTSHPKATSMRHQSHLKAC